jgi:hypothetical protein
MILPLLYRNFRLIAVHRAIGADEMFLPTEEPDLTFIVFKLAHADKFAMTIEGKLSVQSKKTYQSASTEQGRFEMMDISLLAILHRYVE